MAVTGKGAFPLLSPWLGRGRGRGWEKGKADLFYRLITFGDDDDAERAVWSDWFFAAAPAAPSSPACLYLAARRRRM